EGGFYSAEDADSEGKEGKFYCWTRAELSKLLTPEEFNVAVRYFGITEQGNFVDHSDPDPLPNQNILSVVEPSLPKADEPLLQSYAYLLAGVIDVYEATLEPQHLDFAVALADSMIAKFYDPEHGGFWQSAGAADLILRVKEDYDGAEPSGNSVAVLALLKLG